MCPAVATCRKRPSARRLSVFKLSRLKGLSSCCLAGVSLAPPRHPGMGIAGPRDYNGGNIIVIGRIDEAHPADIYALLAILMAAIVVPESFFLRVGGPDGSHLLVYRLPIGRQLDSTHGLAH